MIEDGSLAIRSPDHKLRHVAQVTFTKGEDVQGEFAEIPFDMVWQIALLDGRSLDVNLNARPAMNGVGRMVAWGIHLRA